jgi:hypothetical protein
MTMSALDHARLATWACGATGRSSRGETSLHDQAASTVSNFVQICFRMRAPRCELGQERRSPQWQSESDWERKMFEQTFGASGGPAKLGPLGEVDTLQGARTSRPVSKAASRASRFPPPDSPWAVNLALASRLFRPHDLFLDALVCIFVCFVAVSGKTCDNHCSP